tara:strand:- start:614 stop:1168 length:555 start_codon:yes stop_codon:yes gene_type:complete
MNNLKDFYNSPFKKLKRAFYLGKIKYGTPYFFPRNFNKNILTVIKLELVPEERKEELDLRYPHLKHVNMFKNLPTVRRGKNKIVKIFNKYYFLEIGYPWAIKSNTLGWKEKYRMPRFEWSPAFYIFFFHWQFCIWWKTPVENEDNFWEMFLWWKYFCDEDIIKAEKTWGWQSNGVSTWDKNCLK